MTTTTVDDSTSTRGAPARSRTSASPVTTVAGLAFAILFVLGYIISTTPDYSAPDEEWTSWFEDGGNRTLQLISLFALVAASLCFLVFLAGLVRRLGGLRSDDPWMLVLVAAGIVFVAATAIAAVGLNQVSGAITFGDGPDEYPIPSADVLRQSEQFGFGVGLIAGGWAAAFTVLAASLLGRRTRGFPTWLATAGFVVSAVLLASAFFLPLLVLVAWTIAVSVSTRRLETTTTS